MITTENITALNEYLEENQHRNRTVDKARLTKLRKLGASFDPLLDQSDTDITVTADLDRIADINTEAAAANSSASASVSEREIVVTRRVGIRLTCPFGHVWVYTGRLDRGYTNCSKCKARPIRLIPYEFFSASQRHLCSNYGVLVEDYNGKGKGNDSGNNIGK